MRDVSQETRSKISESLKAYWATRKKQIDSGVSSSGRKKKGKGKSEPASITEGELDAISSQYSSISVPTVQGDLGKKIKANYDQINAEIEQVNQNIAQSKAFISQEENLQNKMREQIDAEKAQKYDKKTEQSKIDQRDAKISELKKQIEESKGRIDARNNEIRLAQKTIGEKKNQQKDIAAQAATIRKSQADIQKYTAAATKAAILEKSIRGKVSSIKTKSAKDKIIAAMQKLQDKKAEIADRIRIAHEIIKTASEGPIKKEVDFNFSDQVSIVCLYEYKPLEIWRELTDQEERCQLQYMNDQFDELQKNIQDELEAQIKADLDKNLPKIERRLTDGDLAAIALLLLFSRRALGDIINRYTKAALEVGKTTASEELKVERPVTPTKTTQVMNFESSELADDFANSIESQVKQIAKEGIAHDIQTTAVVAAIATAAIAKADNLTKGIAGQVIGQNINRGRTTVFDKNKTMIKAFQRSEILDNRTCPFCVELDKKIVSADDPMSRIEQIHTYCRGLWMPIQQTETVDGPVGLPKNIENRFEKVGGVPVINQFKQIKKEKAIAPNSV